MTDARSGISFCAESWRPRALCALLNPTVNSHKRINAPVMRSGATCSPNSVTYSGNNRTHMIRIPEPGRFALRLPDGAANAYLLPAAILAAGIDNMINRRKPVKRLHINMYTDATASTAA